MLSIIIKPLSNSSCFKQFLCPASFPNPTASMDPVKALATATPNVPGSQMSGLIMTKLYLVSGFNPSENMKVSWDYYSQYMEK